MNESDYSITQKEAAEFLNVSTKSISRYRKKGLPYKLILNPESGKQEIRFRRADLERWDDGRQLLATYGRDGTESTISPAGPRSDRQRGVQPHDFAADQNFLAELLKAYKQQIEVLRDQIEDMREQLARRDRQIDDLMRLMVGLQLEFKPMPLDQSQTGYAGEQAMAHPYGAAREDEEVSEAVYHSVLGKDKDKDKDLPSEQTVQPAQQRFSQAQLSASILHLRRKGKSYKEIARGLNKIQVLPLSGASQWTADMVRALLPPLIDLNSRHITIDGEL
jgi:hypothetical protein